MEQSLAVKNVFLRFPKLSLVALGFVSGIVFGLCTPPLYLYPFALLGYAGFGAALCLSSSDETPLRNALGRAAIVGLGFGTGANLVLLRFVPPTVVRFVGISSAVGWLLLLLLCLAQSLIFVAMAVLSAALLKKRAPLVAVLPIGTLFAQFVPTVVFPWSPAGVAGFPISQIQLAEWIGERGVAMGLAALAALLAEAIFAFARGDKAKSAKCVGIIALVIGVNGAFGMWRIARIDSWRANSQTMKIALVDPYIDAIDRWENKNSFSILRRLNDQTKEAESKGVDLTVWSEAAYPYTVLHSSRHSALQKNTKMLQDGVHGPVLIGLNMHDGPNKELSFNSATLVLGDGSFSEPYDKRHLLPFGESIPLEAWFPSLRKAFSRGPRLVPGENNVVFTSGPMRAAVLNCFEDTLPQAGREAMTNMPNLFVNLTNDAWFEQTHESDIHLQISVYRSVEARRDMVRDVNRGATSFVDSAGRIVASRKPGHAGFLIAEPALMNGPATFFTRIGDWPLILLSIGATVYFFFVGRKKEESPT